MISKKTLALTVALIVIAPPLARASGGSADDPALSELVRILRQQGVLSEEQYVEISAKAAARESERSWYDRIDISGDFRLRYEYFDFDDKRDRGRGRYRARLGFGVDVNDYADVFFRLATGALDHRSTNSTIGGSPDFGRSTFGVDQAYARVSPFRNGQFNEGAGSAWLWGGRVPNKFRSKDYGKDFMLWDGDINFDGIGITTEADVTESVNLYARTGFYVIEENSSDRDPFMIAGQIGTNIDAAEHVTFGARTSLYGFSKLTQDFLDRGVKGRIGDLIGSSSTSAGNIEGGLTGKTNGGHLNVISVGSFVLVDYFEDWPIRVYADWAQNLDAASSMGVGKEDTAWGVALEVGSSKKWVKLGAGFWHVEANAFPSQFIDSDLFDGVTNREGWAVYASRKMLANTELKGTLFVSDAIKKSVAFLDSVPSADRLRLQLDAIWSF